MQTLFKAIEGKPCKWQIWVKSKGFVYDLYIGGSFIYSTDKTNECFIIEEKSGGIFKEPLKAFIKEWMKTGTDKGKEAADVFVMNNGGINIRQRPKTKPEFEQKLIQLSYL